MLIPLGFWAASATQAGAGSYDLLATEILTSSQSSVTFSGLSAYSSTYKHLQIRAVGRSDNTGNGHDGIYVRFNGDTGSNYSWHRLEGSGSSVASQASTSQTSMLLGLGTRATAPTGAFAAQTIDILDAFESTKFTTARALVGSYSSSSYVSVSLNSGAWLNTSALTSITLYMSNGNTVSGSRFSLYGLRSV